MVNLGNAPIQIQGQAKIFEPSQINSWSIDLDFHVTWSFLLVQDTIHFVE